MKSSDRVQKTIHKVLRIMTLASILSAYTACNNAPTCGTANGDQAHAALPYT